MARRDFPQQNDDPLAAGLRDAAAASRPPFSEQRHARIMAAVEQAGRNASPARGRPRPGAPRWLAAMAAALVAALGITWWYGVRSPQIAGSPQQSALAGSDTGEGLDDVRAMAQAPDRTAEQLDLLMESTLARRWAYLDHDARVATQLLMEQLPLDLLASGEVASRTDDL